MALECDICGKVFDRRYNLNRHMDIHDEQGETDDEHQVSEDEGEQSEEEVEVDADSDRVLANDQDEYDVWDDMREETLESKGVSEISQETLPIVQRDLLYRYKHRIFILQALRKDRIHRKVMSTKRKLQEDDDYDSDEALEGAIHMRKYLIYRACNFRDEDIDEEDSTDDDNEGGATVKGK